jgi:hypothetical protein
LDVLVAGERRQFFDVPRETYEGLANSPTQKKYFYDFISGNKFEHRKAWRDVKHLLDSLAEDFDGSFHSPVTVNTHASDGDTPLHFACVWGDIEAAEILLKSGADPNAVGDLNCTPLYNAVSFGHVRCAKLLLDAGASADSSNELDSTPRERALALGNPRMIALFSKPAESNG